MIQHRARRKRLIPGLLAATVVAACGGSGGDALPQLAQATPQTLPVACSALADRIGTLPATVLTATSSVPAGSLTVAGQLVRTSNGERIYASFPYDPGIAQPGNAFWEFTAPLQLDSGAVGFVFKVPPEPVAGFNGPAFALNANLDTLVRQITATNATYTESGMSFMTPPNPTDMGRLRDRGGKIIVYHGVSDPIFSVDDSETWYRGLQTANGGDASAFARFFRVPGMGH